MIWKRHTVTHAGLSDSRLQSKCHLKLGDETQGRFLGLDHGLSIDSLTAGPIQAVSATKFRRR